jgi:butyrate kinase
MSAKKYRVLVINPGATSTKISVFDEGEEVFQDNIQHSSEVLSQFAHIIDQKDFRKKLVLNALAGAGIDLSTIDAVSGRGGLLKHIPSGTYAINDAVIEDVKNPPYGEHASNLGVVLAREIGDSLAKPSYFSDPVSTDELCDLARVSGFAPMQRESFFHALNQKGKAREAAAMIGRPYEELDLIVVHMGGGVSIAAHHLGRVIDMFNVKDDGSFSMDRGGALPVNAVINYCFSGRTKAEVKKTLGTEAGVYSYLGTRDFRDVEKMMDSGDEKAALIFRAMAFQHAKDIGAMAAVLHFHVDAIVLTGGIAYSKRFCDEICSYVGNLAPVMILPGEAEMRSLALGTLRVLHGAPCMQYV